MRRSLPFFLVALLLGSCAPVREPPPGAEAGAGSSSAWLVVTMVQNNYETISHQFVTWNGGGRLCSVMTEYYEGLAEAYADYAAASAAFQQKWGYDYYSYSDPEYRRQYCELYRSYYAGYASSGSEFDNGRELLTLSLNHPESSDGTPREGTYGMREYDYYYYNDNTPWFSGNRVVHLTNFYQAYVDAMDCDAYAEDPSVGLYPSGTEFEEAVQNYSVIGGTLEVTAASDSAWHLSLADGLQRDDAGAQSDLALDARFSRCEIRYEYPDYYAYDG